MTGAGSLPFPPPLGAAMLPGDTFAGQLVFITGGGSGLGLAMAREFARAGASVAITSRNEIRRARAVEEIEQLGGRCLPLSMDVRRPEDVEAAFEQLDGEGGVDVLVNNAAANFFSPAEAITPGGWSAVIDRVLTGTFLCSREFFARRQGKPGAILNIGAPTAVTGGPGVAHSAAAKAGVINLTKSLAVEWARDGVRVNCLVPGIFPHGDDDPSTQAGRLHFGEDAGLRMVAGRAGQPHELAWLATFLCSPFATFITGQTLMIDGGDSLRRWVLHPEFVPVRDQLQQARDGEE